MTDTFAYVRYLPGRSPEVVGEGGEVLAIYASGEEAEEALFLLVAAPPCPECGEARLQTRPGFEPIGATRDGHPLATCPCCEDAGLAGWTVREAGAASWAEAHYYVDAALRTAKGAP